MDDQPSKIWNVALVFSLLLLAGVLYYRFAPVREIVDAKCPWIKEQLAQHGIQFSGAAAATPEAPAPANSGAANPPQPLTSAPTRPLTSAPAQRLAVAQPQPMSLAQIASNQSLWPKVVKIKKPIVFPAVLNGKEVGKLSVPAGTEVKLISVTPEKVGVAYSPDGTMPNAGGAWLLAAETDLIERVYATH